MSRLLYNVHVWFNFSGKARTILNAMYMRVWRRIANDPRYTKTKWSDLQIRLAMNIPYIDVCIRKKRLKYLARLATCNVEPLRASLQCISHKGEQMPWVQLVTNDVKIFLEHPKVAAKLQEVKSSPDQLQACWQLAHDYPKERSNLVNL